jgi:Cu2+-exporting ATPase
MARTIDVVLFDKTGTLTKGEFGVEQVWPIAAKNETEVLQMAASVDAHSEHFVSQAIVKKAQENKIALKPLKDFARLSGKGVHGIVDGSEMYVGGQAILEYAAESPSDDLEKRIKEENRKGKTIIFVIKNRKLFGVISLADLIREESRTAIADLKRLGVKVAMITGDADDVARWVSDELQIDEYFARVLPGEKSEKVKLLQSKGLKVAMVGDGINDAPALTQADLGIAIGAGTNVAIESAGIILVKNDPRDIVKIIRLSRLTYNKMIQNLFWASGYNLIALPLAAGVLYNQGILLQPAVSALFMSLSTVIVAANAVLLRKKIL